MFFEDSPETYVYDIESYSDQFVAGFYEVNSGTFTQFEISARRNDGPALKSFVNRAFFIVGFNNHYYDDLMLHRALTCHDAAKLNVLSHTIIESEDRWGPGSPFVTSPLTIDLRSIIGEGSLKEIGVKLDHPKLQELPFDPHAPLGAENFDAMLAYNRNDLLITAKLLRNQRAAIASRIDLTAAHGTNVLSKKDSGIGEAIIRARYERVLPNMDEWNALGQELLSEKIVFVDPELRALHERVKGHELRYKLAVEAIEAKNPGGRIEYEKRIDTESFSDRVTVRGVNYSVGLGGLHSEDDPAIIAADETHDLWDIDFTSFYPMIVMGLKLCPSHLDRKRFLSVFGDLIKERVAAKTSGQTVRADGLKIAINSIFGKFKSAYSWMCDPLVGVAVTLNGQMILLMLVEFLLCCPDLEILSANTDGLLVRVNKGDETFREVAAAIEDIFETPLEFTRVSRIARRDVNNYVALVDKNGKWVVKAKGAYGFNAGIITKKATNRIVITAVQDYFLHGTPVEDTVRGCREIVEFVDYFRAARGFTCEDENGVALPSINRWYQSTTGMMLWKTRTKDGQRFKFGTDMKARLVNDLPETFPDDVDFEFYIALAKKRVAEIENPAEWKSYTIDFADMTPQQTAHLAAKTNDHTFDIMRCQGVDLTRFIEAYISKSKGSEYDTMKSILPWLWRSQGGALTAGDLQYLAQRIDDSEGYFAKGRKRKLTGLVDWVATHVCPFPKVDELEKRLIEMNERRSSRRIAKIERLQQQMEKQ